MRFNSYTKIVLSLVVVCLTCLGLRDGSVSLPRVHAESQAKVRQVSDYRLAWNKTFNTGRVALKFTDGATIEVTVTSAADLAGWAAVLNQKPAYVNTDGWIYTGIEAPGR